MKHRNLWIALTGAVILSACNNSQPSPDLQTKELEGGASVTAGQGVNSVQLSTGSGNTSSLQVGSGESAVVVGDIQQTQDGVGQTDLVNVGTVPAGVTAMVTGDGRSVTVKNGQMVLHREGGGTITIPAAR